MAAGEDDNKKEQGKGFAGLSSLVSDVDATPPPVAKKTASTTGTASEASRPVPQAAPSQQEPRSGSSAGKWWVGIAVVVGVLWIIGQANETTTTSPAPTYSSPTQNTAPSDSPSEQQQAPSHPAQPEPSPVNTGSNLMSAGDGAVYRVPSFRLSELENDKRAVESAQQEAKNLEGQAERLKTPLDVEKQQIDQAQQELDSLGDWIERQRSLIDDANQYEIDSFNSKVREYNAQKTQLQDQINNFNTDVNTYNMLLQRVRDAEQSANQKVDGYNSKLEQYGTRQ